MARMKEFDYAWLMRDEQAFERQERQQELLERQQEQEAIARARQRVETPMKKLRRYR